MANLKVDTLSGIGTEGTVFDGGLKFRSKNYLTLPKGTTTERTATSSGISTEIGSIRYNTDSNKMECYVNNKWMIVSTTEASPIAGRGLMFSGYVSPSNTNIIDYINIQTTGDSVDFGDLTDNANDFGSGYGNETRAVYAGGQNSLTNVISFVTIATTGNAADFGDMLTVQAFSLGFAGDSSRAVLGGGITPSVVDTIQFITMPSTGNAIDFGNLTQGRQSGQSVNSSTRGIYGGGGAPAPTAHNIMDFVTIQSTGNAVDFGDLASAGRLGGSACNAVRGIFAGDYGVGSPYPQTNVIQFITMASTGNAQDFGDLMQPINDSTGQMCNSTRGVFVHGYSPSPHGYNNAMSYINIATKGNSVNFGDRTSNTAGTGRASNTHGGL